MQGVCPSAPRSEYERLASSTLASQGRKEPQCPSISVHVSFIRAVRDGCTPGPTRDHQSAEDGCPCESNEGISLSEEVVSVMQERHCSFTQSFIYSLIYSPTHSFTTHGLLLRGRDTQGQLWDLNKFSCRQDSKDHIAIA